MIDMQEGQLPFIFPQHHYGSIHKFIGLHNALCCSAQVYTMTMRATRVMTGLMQMECVKAVMSHLHMQHSKAEMDACSYLRDVVDPDDSCQSVATITEQ